MQVLTQSIAFLWKKYGCPKSLGHFMTPHMSKTIVRNVNSKTSPERINSGNYFDTKLDPIGDTSCTLIIRANTRITNTNIIYILDPMCKKPL